VTTVPTPGKVNTRSTGSRNGASAERAARRPQPARARPAGRPSPRRFRRHRHERGVLERRGFERFPGQVGRKRPQVVVGEVGLGERDDAAGDAERGQDVEVLAGLRHRAFVGGDDHQGDVHAARPGEHVLHEPLVAGHVDDPGLDRRVAGQREVREAQIYGHAARLFLGEPISVDPRERADQRRLAVVHVPRRADDHVPDRRGAGSPVCHASLFRGPGRDSCAVGLRAAMPN
jgi:hypothetical protein